MLFIQMTGLSGAGKSTLANYLHQKCSDMGYTTTILDGDVYRKSLCKDLGFSKKDRIENIQRLSNLGFKLCRPNSVVILAAINPFEEIRSEIQSKGDFVKTIWVQCSLNTLIKRDTKGLYKRALLADTNPDKIYNLTGVNAEYEPPKQADLILNTDKESLEFSQKKVFITVQQWLLDAKAE